MNELEASFFHQQCYRCIGCSEHAILVIEQSRREFPKTLVGSYGVLL